MTLLRYIRRNSVLNQSKISIPVQKLQKIKIHKIREILFYAKNKQKAISGIWEKDRNRSKCFLHFLVKRREAERGMSTPQHAINRK